MLKQFLPGYTHKQIMSSNIWTVVHNLKRDVCVDVYVDFQGRREKILPLNVVIVDDTTLRVEFSSAMSGIVRVI